MRLPVTPVIYETVEKCTTHGPGCSTQKPYLPTFTAVPVQTIFSRQMLSNNSNQGQKPPGPDLTLRNLFSQKYLEFLSCCGTYFGQTSVSKLWNILCSFLQNIYRLGQSIYRLKALDSQISEMQDLIQFLRYVTPCSVT